MTFSLLDSSRYDGKPIELYRFVRGSRSWGYTNAQEDIEYQGLVFKQTALRRENVKVTSDIFKDSLSIDFPANNAIAADLLAGTNNGITTLTVLKGNLGDNDYVTLWKGRVVGAEVREAGKITISGESVYTSVRRLGLSAKFEYNCRHVLFGASCGVNRELVKVTGAITSFDSQVKLIIPAAASKPSGWFTGGMIYFSNGNVRFITSHTDATIVISIGGVGVGAGTPVTLYPGCDHSLTTCGNKYSNVRRFGGFPWIPNKNPYGGGSIV
jgi:phage conserved hypothetical protein BR0599